MEQEKLVITFDPNDLMSMQRLMDKYGDSETMYTGINVLEEDVRLSIFHNRIVCVTLQHNGWVRINTYWNDGTREETFDGRWADK